MAGACAAAPTAPVGACRGIESVDRHFEVQDKKLLIFRVEFLPVFGSRILVQVNLGILLPNTGKTSTPNPKIVSS